MVLDVVGSNPTSRPIEKQALNLTRPCQRAIACYTVLVMALKLYRRHRKECEGGHPEDSRSGEFEEGRRGWKRCACVIHVTGTLGGKFSRKQTGQWEWEDARTVAAR